jgi:hypothetical protein
MSRKRRSEAFHDYPAVVQQARVMLGDEVVVDALGAIAECESLFP